MTIKAAGPELHVGDIGTSLRLHLIDENNLTVDVASATTMECIMLSPKGRRLVRPLSLLTDGHDGMVGYVFTADDLDVAGFWRLQAFVVIGAGSWYSNIALFTVVANL